MRQSIRHIMAPAIAGTVLVMAASAAWADDAGQRDFYLAVPGSAAGAPPQAAPAESSADAAPSRPIRPRHVTAARQDSDASTRRHVGLRQTVSHADHMRVVQHRDAGAAKAPVHARFHDPKLEKSPSSS